MIGFYSRVAFGILVAGLGLALSTVGSGAQQRSGGADDVGLTYEERVWIAQHPVIRLMPDPLFPPFEYFDEKGIFQGIGADFVDLVEDKLGIRFDVIRAKDWQESVAKTKNRENDIWSVVAKTPERSEYMLFTKPYIESPAVILIRNDIDRRLGIDDLKDMKVTVSSGYAVHEFLKTNHPEIAFDAVSDPLTGLKNVSLGIADAMVVNIALASHLMEKAGIANLRLAGEVGYTYRWGFASRKDWPELHSILEKGLARISREERQAITRKWVALKEQPWAPTKTMVFSVLGALAVMIIAGVLVWNRALKHQIRLRTQEVETELRERKLAEETLLENEKLLSTAIESISDGFILTDVDDRIVLFNRKLRNLYPNSFDLIIKGRQFEDFLRGGAERGEFPNAIDHVDEWMKERTAERKENVSIVEMPLIGDRWVRAASQQLPSGGRVGIHVDLTELKQAQESLQNRAELIQLLRRTASDANKADNLTDAMRDAIDNVCAYNGWPIGHAYVLSKDTHALVPSDIWHLDDPDRFATFREVTDKTVFEKGVGLPGRVMASGEPAWIIDVTKDSNFPRAKLADSIGVKAGFACPVLVGSKIVAVLEFFAPETIEPDQTLLDALVQIGLQLGRVAEREQAEQELQAQRDQLEELNEQKNKFFSIIAHDLKGPFTSLLGASDLMVNLVGKVSQDELVELAGSVNRGGKRVFELLENLLEWSRLQMGKVEFEPAPLDLLPLVQKNADLVRPVAREKGIEVVNDVPDVAVMADKNMVDTVVRNLLNNALKFTEKSGRITVSAKANRQLVEVSVADTGVGMAAEKVAKLFKLDQKTSTAGTAGEAGTGLGLHLCKDLVERQGGAIRVESTEGQGSTFSFTLPLPPGSGNAD